MAGNIQDGKKYIDLDSAAEVLDAKLRAWGWDVSARPNTTKIYDGLLPVFIFPSKNAVTFENLKPALVEAFEELQRGFSFANEIPILRGAYSGDEGEVVLLSKSGVFIPDSPEQKLTPPSLFRVRLRQGLRSTR